MIIIIIEFCISISRVTQSVGLNWLSGHQIPIWVNGGKRWMDFMTRTEVKWEWEEKAVRETDSVYKLKTGREKASQVEASVSDWVWRKGWGQTTFHTKKGIKRVKSRSKGHEYPLHRLTNKEMKYLLQTISYTTCFRSNASFFSSSVSSVSQNFTWEGVHSGPSSLCKEKWKLYASPLGLKSNSVSSNLSSSMAKRFFLLQQSCLDRQTAGRFEESWSCSR